MVDMTRREESTLPLAQKYSPKSHAEIWNRNYARRVAQYIKKFDENRFFDDSATALMLHGPRGSGKTSIVRAISARSPNYSLLEVNTSSERRG